MRGLEYMISEAPSSMFGNRKKSPMQVTVLQCVW